MTAPTELATTTEPAPSLFVEFMAEAVPPLLLEVANDEIVVSAPPADAVADLDHLLGTRDVQAWIELVSPDLVDLLAAAPWSEHLDAVAGIRDHYGLVQLVPGLWAALVERLDLYGEAIETDLFDRGSDLLDWFRGRRPWPQLLRLVDRLPPESHYKAALLDDEELARERLEQETVAEEPGGKHRPPLVGESQLITLTRSIASALPRIEHAVYAVNAPKGKSGRPPSPLPGPETAEDRVRAQLGDADVEELMAAATPWDAAARRQPGFTTSSAGLYVPDR